MAWTWLLLAGCCEIAWALALKFTDGFRRPLPSLFTAAAIAASMFFLARAARSLPIGTAYAVWTGIGIVGTAVGGMWLFAESRQPLRLVSIALILAGLIGLRFGHA
ncbi:MAG TPA: multidrug efflux SMR transporter [Terriglobales bacterium]|nr:multidrug efflux SMR transporter [Terriglobales bacterium]